MEIVNAKRVPVADISGSYGYAWKQLWKYFLYFFLVAVIVALFESPASVFDKAENYHNPQAIGLQLLGVAFLLLVVPVIKYGADLLYLRGIRDEKMELAELFAGFKNNYLNIILAHLLHVAIIGIGFVFLIIPGIILACRLVFIPYLVMDKNLEPVAAMEKSWDMTRGHGWTVFGMALLAIPVFIAGLLCFLVGAFISVMWISAAFATLYHALDLKEDEAVLRNSGD
jgi:uncharacterized membrane protein